MPFVFLSAGWYTWSNQYKVGPEASFKSRVHMIPLQDPGLFNSKALPEPLVFGTRRVIPGPRLPKFRRACCLVHHMSGVTGYIDELLHNLDETKDLCKLFPYWTARTHPCECLTLCLWMVRWFNRLGKGVQSLSYGGMGYWGSSTEFWYRYRSKLVYVCEWEEVADIFTTWSLDIPITSKLKTDAVHHKQNVICKVNLGIASLLEKPFD
jgi:hypothetical protein